jgi:hypothetical protein
LGRIFAPRNSSTVRPTVPARSRGTPLIFFASMTIEPRISSFVPSPSSRNFVVPRQVTASVKACVSMRQSQVKAFSSQVA